jgi:Holliday junction resolvasome RuvABC endonuclease subunit
MVVGERLHKDATDTERARRCETIAMRIVAFARACGCTSAWVEGYAFSQHSAAHTLAEVGGVVRLELVRAGLDVHTANMSSSRKFLLGKCPKGAKQLVFEALRAAGAHFETLDESDAFCAVNLGLSEEGGYCLCQNEPSLSQSQSRVIRASNSAVAALSGGRSSAVRSAPCVPPAAKHSTSTARISLKSSKKKT